MQLPILIDNEASSLTERVFHTLKGGILSLEIKPREYLVIGDIAREYGVSRTPVREALIMLEREGWLEHDGRRGARVTVPSAKMILEVIEVQAALEGYLARRVAALLTSEDIQQLEAILAKADATITTGEESKGQILGQQFHDYLADKVGNRKLKAEIDQLQEHIDRVRPMIWHHAIVPIKNSAAQHWDILNALKAGNAFRAEELMVYHTMWYEKELAAVLQSL
jgi:DNA-binding GntR family transcriptional regulator